jgi:intergrase/recombinase
MPQRCEENPNVPERESHGLYYLIYRLMLEGGLKLSRALLLVKSFSPEELV